MAELPRTPEETLIAEAADVALRRIRRHRRKVRAQVVPLLEKIEERLLDDQLTIEALRRWSEVGDKNISTLFAQDLGLTPWDYITARRMEVAERLLAVSDLPVWEIASIVGYGAAQSFSRAYRRLRGCSPTDYRREARTERKPEPEPLIPSTSPAQSLAAGIRRAGAAMATEHVDLEESIRNLADHLAPEEAGELLMRMREYGRRMQQTWTEVSFYVTGLEILFEKAYREQSTVRSKDSET